MGAKVSVSMGKLDLPSIHGVDDDRFRGTLILTNNSKKKIKITRAPHVSFQVRATLNVRHAVDPLRDIIEKVEHEHWKIGGPVTESTTVILQLGENRFHFDFSAMTQVNRKPLEPPEYWYERFNEDFVLMYYDCIVRAGCPPEIKDVIQYHPQLIPPQFQGPLVLRRRTLFTAGAIFGAVTPIAVALTGK